MAKSRITVRGEATEAVRTVLSDEALEFLSELHERFDAERLTLLARRDARQTELDAGALPGFLPSTRDVRARADWKAASCPADLLDRRVEITGPVERKMMINALNSGAKCFMADLEDSLSPTWENVIQGQLNLMAAVRHELSFTSPEGKSYRLNERIATLLVRPRGLHLPEKHLEKDGRALSGSLVDFGLYMFHNARERVARGTAPYFYLPKMESHLEARWWNEVIVFAQTRLGVPHGTVRVTVLIETILAAYEMEEILYELRDHISGLNAGRWDYIFSAIKKFRNRPEFMLPDRAQVTMTVPFMRAYTELLVRTCHKRGAHAMGGMAAYIPSRKDAAVNEVALAKVREDKEREARDGFDGTWVAHPDLVPVAMESFDRVMGSRPNQKEKLREDIRVTEADLVDIRVPGGKLTEAGIRNNVSVALQYVERWLAGTGAVAIFNLMEDAATAEIARAQLWQWLRHGAEFDGAFRFSKQEYLKIREEELTKLGGPSQGRFGEAAALLDTLVTAPEFREFLTVPAYQRLEN